MMQHGFVSREMLVALSALALGVGVFLLSFGSNLRIENAPTRVFAASQLAETLIARAGAELPLDGLDATGGYDGLTWRLSAREVIPRAKDSALPRIFQVSAKIAWSEGGPGRQRDMTFTTVKIEQAR